MPRIRKTSTQPKRKPKKVIIIPKKIYPEFVENFIKEVESKTPFKVIVDEFNEGSGYQIGVLKKIPSGIHHCIWMASYAKTPEELAKFWLVDNSKYL
jgi:hypothetical protein